MINILTLQDAHKGYPGAVLGGGPSLEADLRKVLTPPPAPPRPTPYPSPNARTAFGEGGKRDKERGENRPVLISVNLHGAQLVQADYMVFLDDPNSSLAMLDALYVFGGLRVSWRLEWTDVDLAGAEWWRGLFSSYLATWLACYLGCNPVILCGMDCYQNPRPAEADPRDLAYTMPLKEHLDGWREAFEKCPHSERIKAVSGPLVDVFGAFQ